MNEELRKGNSIFFIELEKIEPNPYQPRIEFNQSKLETLADSIKQYGVLQPIVVSRKEEYSEEFGIKTKYQIIAGERRFRASKIAGLKQIPAIIREGEQSDAEKLELAIIENLQREDLNPVDKARAFKKLADDFKLTHAEIAKKMGKSREYVSNTMRILMLPENILVGLTVGKISEGHTRSLLMLKERFNEQSELYKRIINDKLTVRAAEKIARSVATDKIRKKIDLDPEIKQIETHIREKLGTKVTIDQKPIGDGGKLTIEYFSKDDLKKILEVIEKNSSNDIEKDKLILDEEFNENCENTQPTILKEEIDKLEQFEISNKSDKVQSDLSEKNFDFANNNSELVNNWGSPQKSQEINKNIDGLEKIEIKNDFDKTRIDSFKKSDEILKSFGAPVVTQEVFNNLENSEKIVENNSFVEEKMSGNESVEEDVDYSNLYSEFLKSKEKIIGMEDGRDDLGEKKLGDVGVVLDPADNIKIVEKTNVDLNQDKISQENPFIKSEEKVEVEFVAGETEGFLADAKKDKDEVVEVIEDDDINEDEKYSFKGFSI